MGPLGWNLLLNPSNMLTGSRDRAGQARWRRIGGTRRTAGLAGARTRSRASANCAPAASRSQAEPAARPGVRGPPILRRGAPEGRGGVGTAGGPGPARAGAGGRAARLERAA
jgi:hypothetical protein